MQLRHYVIRAGFILVAGSAAWAQVTQRISVDSSGMQGNGPSASTSISDDGRLVAFVSSANNLVPGDTNQIHDVFVRDRHSGSTERVSLGMDGTEGNSNSGNLGFAISADGRYVAFHSYASNLVPEDNNGTSDVFVRDRLNGTTERVSVTSDGEEADFYSWYCSISADGRCVAFFSAAANLVPDDTNASYDVFVHDRQNGTTERVSVDSGGIEGNDQSGEFHNLAISADGRYVAFESYASNLVPGDTNGVRDVFVHDRQNDTTERVSVSTDGIQGNGASDSIAISADGRYVAFQTQADNLIPGDTNLVDDVLLHDRQSGTTQRVSIATSGTPGNLESYSPSLSADGRYVAFTSFANNLVPGDTNGQRDVFLHDRQTGRTERVSLSTSGGQGFGASDGPAISATGRYVTFTSEAGNLVPGDTNGTFDAFLRDRDATGFASLCDPGNVGAIPCPCLNPPAGSERGCDNSAMTGGASLSASGPAYLSMDSIVFTTNGETPAALSILMQGNGSIPAGVLYGQGVRCVGGTIIRRLFTKSASSGSITVPDFASGDPSVSARSAEKGDLIQAGQSRWYLVYYRDPVVLGGCPGSSTFNATQTGRVDWSL